MRSEAIFRAKEAVSNRYQLCQTVAKATRRMYVASRNQQDTINSALEKVAGDAPVVAVKRVVL